MRMAIGLVENAEAVNRRTARLKDTARYYLGHAQDYLENDQLANVQESLRNAMEAITTLQAHLGHVASAGREGTRGAA